MSGWERQKREREKNRKIERPRFPQLAFFPPFVPSLCPRRSQGAGACTAARGYPRPPGTALAALARVHTSTHRRSSTATFPNEHVVPPRVQALQAVRPPAAPPPFLPARGGAQPAAAHAAPLARPAAAARGPPRGARRGRRGRRGEARGRARPRLPCNARGRPMADFAKTHAALAPLGAVSATAAPAARPRGARRSGTAPAHTRRVSGGRHVKKKKKRSARREKKDSSFSAAPSSAPRPGRTEIARSGAGGRSARMRAGAPARPAFPSAKGAGLTSAPVQGGGALEKQQKQQTQAVTSRPVRAAVAALAPTGSAARRSVASAAWPAPPRWRWRRRRVDGGRSR